MGANGPFFNGLTNNELGGFAMWISLFSIATAAAICLSVAAIIMQPTGGRPFRG